MKKKEKNLTISEEEIRTNHVVKKSHARLYVFGTLGLTIFVVVFSSLYRNTTIPDYPVVFRDANNKLMVITKSANGKNDITNISDANIVYGNKDIRYILYTNETALYLLDTTVGGSGILLSTDAVNYGFSSDDKNVYYIESNGDLHIYNRSSESNYLVDSNTTHVTDIFDDFIVYSKNGALLIKDYVHGDLDIVSSSYSTVIVSKDNKYLLYSIEENGSYNYYVYEISDSNSKKVLEGVSELLSYNNNFTKFMYTVKKESEINLYSLISDSLSSSDKKLVNYSEEDINKGIITKEEYITYEENKKQVEERNLMREYAKKYKITGYDVYYQNKDTTTLIANGINHIYLDEIDDLRLVYTKDTWNKDFDLSTYSTFDEFKRALEENKLNTLYYKEGTNEESKITSLSDENMEVNYISGDGVYYLLDSSLYYSHVSGHKASTSSLVDENILSTNLNLVSDLGLIYLTNSNDNNSLKYMKEGKYKVINEGVYADYLFVSEKETMVYYVKDYQDHKGTLMLFNGILNSKISEDVASLMYINDDLMYVTKNYNNETKTSDLYRVNGTKLTLIYEGIQEWYNPVEEKEKVNE